MTGSHAQTGRPNLMVRMWRGFRRFRRTRPFWGGVFAMLGGMEIFVIPLSSNIKVAVYGGIGGTLGYLLGALIFMMGISFWTLPHLRQLTGPGAILFSLASFVFSNLGGFFLGMLLGIIGGSLGFSWMPARPKEQGGEEPAGPTGGDDGHGEDVGLSVLDERPPPPPAEGSGGGSRTPTTLAVAIPALALALGLAQLAGTHMDRAYAAAPCATASPSPAPSASASTPAGTTGTTGSTGSTVAATKAAASPNPSPSPSPTASGFDWFWWWPFKSDSGSAGAAATPTATPTATSTATPTASPGGSQPARPKAAADPTASPTTCPTPGGSASPKPSTSASPPAGVKPKDVPPPTGTVVAGKPTVVTASVVEMYGVDYKGVTTVDLPGNKTRRVLWFQMDRLVLHNFAMTDDENVKTMQWVADPLTLTGHVNIYTADMQATLLGIPLHFTPDSPPPLVLPIMILGDLVQSQDLTTCDTLSGKPLDNKFLS